MRALYGAAEAVGASLRLVQSYPDFRRFVASRADEHCKVDLVIDRAPALETDKPTFERVRLDSRREIAANKVCALVGRSEIRDLVDLRALLDAGCDLDAALRDALVKDGGADAATLAWLLDQLVIGAEARLPGGVDPVELSGFRDALVVRLRAIAAAQTRR